MAGDRLFGMIQPSEGPAEETGSGAGADDDASGDDEPPGLFAVGCIGRIMSFNEREDGTCSIALAGIARFRVGRELDGLRGYRRLSVSYFGYAQDLEDVEAIDFDREALVGVLRRYFAHRGFEARWEAIEQMDDETLLTTLGMICPFPPAEKQALLEARTLADRARTLQALLEMAEHEVDPGGGGRPHAI